MACDICAKTRFAFAHGHDESGGRIPGRRPLVSIGVWHHLDPRHHAPILVLEDMTVADELAAFGEGNVHHDRR